MPQLSTPLPPKSYFALESTNEIVGIAGFLIDLRALEIDMLFRLDGVF